MAHKFAGKDLHSGRLRRQPPTLACLLTPNVNVGLPSSSVVTLGARLPKNFRAVSNTFSTEVLIDSAMALATAVRKLASLSVGHKST